MNRFIQDQPPDFGVQGQPNLLLGLTRNTPVTPDGKSAMQKLRKETYRYEQEALQRKHYSKMEHQLSP